VRETNQRNIIYITLNVYFSKCEVTGNQLKSIICVQIYLLLLWIYSIIIFLLYNNILYYDAQMPGRSRQLITSYFEFFWKRMAAKTLFKRRASLQMQLPNMKRPNHFRYKYKKRTSCAEKTNIMGENWS